MGAVVHASAIETSSPVTMMRGSAEAVGAASATPEHSPIAPTPSSKGSVSGRAIEVGRVKRHYR